MKNMIGVYFCKKIWGLIINKYKGKYDKSI